MAINMAGSTKSISTQQARKLILHSQKLPPTVQKDNAISATLSSIEHLGYIQIDTISAIQRAHHHTLWNRNPRYENSHLDQLIDDKKVFEYWTHAASYIPMSEFRYSLPRKQALARGELNHWFDRDEQLMSSILNRISEEGPLMAKDFHQKGQKTAVGESKPSKRALDNLFMQGDLMISKRVNFHKVYDLTERVLTENIDVSVPSPEEYARFLITRYFRANGLGQAGEITYLLKNIKSLVSKTLQQMVEESELIELEVANSIYYALPTSLHLLDKPLDSGKLQILSPFDNFLIQRKRMLLFFEYDYQIECYLPKNKRKFGYFSLPVLWDGKLIARMDCKAERTKSLLHINNIALEAGLAKTEEFSIALSKELVRFMKFNNCSAVILHKTTPSSFKAELLKTSKKYI
jgi:uncharacterized protein